MVNYGTTDGERYVISNQNQFSTGPSRRALQVDYRRASALSISPPCTLRPSVNTTVDAECYQDGSEVAEP